MDDDFECEDGAVIGPGRGVFLEKMDCNYKFIYGGYAGQIYDMEYGGFCNKDGEMFVTKIDDPNTDKPIEQRIRNAGLNLDKLLNLLQQSFVCEQNVENQKELNSIYKSLRQKYEELEKMEERQSLKIFRDKLAAHIDYKFVKREDYANLDFSNVQAINLTKKVLEIIATVGGMICTEKELVALIPFDPNRKTPIDGLF